MDAETLSQQRLLAALERSSNLSGVEPVGDGHDDGSGARQIAETVAVIEAASAKIQANDFSAVETIFAGQALALDVIFNQHARESARYFRSSTSGIVNNMRIALKAQAQCRATLESLMSVKQPRPRASARRTNGGTVQNSAFLTEQTGESGKSPA